jgi:hypothetical protein
MIRAVVPAGEAMVRDMQTLSPKKRRGQGPSLKNMHLERLRKHREKALRESRVHAVKYCDQFVPKVLLNVAPSSMVCVCEDPGSGELSIEPAAAASAEASGVVVGTAIMDATGATLVAAIPLILDLSRTFVQDKLERRVKTFFRQRMDKWQAQLSTGKTPPLATIPLATASGESGGKLSHESKVVAPSLRAATTTMTTSRQASKKNVSRLTSSDKLLCSFLAQNDFQRHACLVVLEIARLVRQFSVAAKDMGVHPSSGDDTAAAHRQNLRALEAKAAVILDMTGNKLQPNLSGLFMDQVVLRHDLELLRLIVTGPIAESLVLCLMGVTGGSSHAGNVDAIVYRVLEALVGVVAAAKRSCPAVVRGLFGCVVHRLVAAQKKSEKHDALAPRVECFATAMRVGGVVGTEDIQRCKRRFLEEGGNV